MLKKIILWTLGAVVAIAAVLAVMVFVRYEAYPAEPSTRVAELPNLTPHHAQLTEQLEDYRDTFDVPSISIAVGKDGQLVYAGAVGYADLAGEVAATPDSLYRIGSVSKSITAAAMGALVESGAYDLDADYRSYVPSFPEKRWPFSSRQLASHLAGVRHYRRSFLAGMAEQFHDVHYERVLDSLVLVKDDPLLFEPGTSYSYSSYGYNMLSAAMVAADGRAFTQILDEEIFQPADMASTFAEDAPSPHPQSVSYYLQFDGASIRAPYADNSYKIAGGGLIATPSDLVRFGQALLANKIINQDTAAELYTVQPLTDGSVDHKYALGFRVADRTINQVSYQEIGHGGGSIGGITAFIMLPEADLVLAAAINISPWDSQASPFAIAYEFAEVLLTPEG